MPELPEVESVRLSLLDRVVRRRLGKVRVRNASLRAPVDARALQRLLPGRRVLGIRRRAKYLLFDVEGGHVLLVHLGMTGRLGIFPATTPLETHDHVTVETGRGQELRFNDARRFGLVQIFKAEGEQTQPRLRHLGIEPLDQEFHAAWLHRAARGRQRPIKTFIMDAALVVGIGNIYACEVLHTSGIHPRRAAGSLSLRRWERLADAVRRTLADAIDDGGTTLRDYVNGRGEAGSYAPRLQVYGRAGEPCLSCGRPVRRLVQSGRSTFYCPGCQH